VTSCTDVTDGTEATCCLPAGTLPGALPSGAALADGGSIVSVSEAGAGADANGNESEDSGGDANDSGNVSDAGGDADAGVIVDAGDAGG
jgi:hypothetical protein